MWDFKTSSFIVPRLLPYVGIALSAVAPLQGAVISARSASRSPALRGIADSGGEPGIGLNSLTA